MEVTIYTTPNCPLCDEAEALVRHLQPEYGYRVTVVDITKDASRYEPYRLKVPVIALDGEERLHGRIEERDLRDVVDPEREGHARP